MRAITILQPYAFAIASGAKDVENRTRSTPWTSAIEQRVAIHAGLRWHSGALDDPRILRLGQQTVATEFGGAVPGAALVGFLVPQGHILGAVVAVATLADAHWAEACASPPVRRQRPVDDTGDAGPAPGLCSPWAEPDCWHLVWRDVRPLVTPVPARGFQGLWSLKDEELDQVLAQDGGAE